jgi:hypothetical protein
MPGSRTTSRNVGKPKADPSQPLWIYDQSGHSEGYNHSTFNDLVISGMIGLRPQAGNTLVLKPLVPASWDHFVPENAPYHGHNVTVLDDRTGHRYDQGPTLHVYVDGRQVADAPSVRDMSAAAHPSPPPTSAPCTGQSAA